MEKFSSVDRVIGNLTEEERKMLLLSKKENFEKKSGWLKEGKEVQKTETDLRIIEEVNEATNALRKKYGLPDFDVPADNIHFFTEENTREAGIRCGGFYSQEEQAAFVPHAEELTREAKNTFHELVHFKSYGAIQKLSDTGEITQYRTGLSMYPRSQEKADEINNGKENAHDLAFFDDLNEAITEELAKRYILSQKENPLYAKEFEVTDSVKNFMKEKGRPDYDDPDVFLIRVYPETSTFRKFHFGYKANRDALSEIIEHIFTSEKNIGKFKNKDEVFDVFARAMFTGHMMELAHLLDSTFGKGTLRSIATP